MGDHTLISKLFVTTAHGADVRASSNLSERRLIYLNPKREDLDNALTCLMVCHQKFQISLPRTHLLNIYSLGRVHDHE